MSTDLDRTKTFETALDVQRAEYDLKKRELELAEKSRAKWWRSPIFLVSLIPSIIAGLIALGVAYTENEAVKISGQNDLFRTEQGKILETLNLPSNERMSLLCALHHSKLFEHQDIC